MVNRDANNISPGPYYLPGDKKNRDDVDGIIRVDHAGEYGATRIYKGQLDVLENSDIGDMLNHMQGQEKIHLQKFNDLLNDHAVRPSILSPFWHISGYFLGFFTAKMGKNAAFACTEAVETVIDDHYTHQYNDLNKKKYGGLAATIEKFRQEEVEHKEMAIANGSRDTAAHGILSSVIKFGSTVSIWIARRF